MYGKISHLAVWILIAAHFYNISTLNTTPPTAIQPIKNQFFRPETVNYFFTLVSEIHTAKSLT